MLINEIKADPVLSNYLGDSCEENGISARIDPSIVKGDILILKVDKFYAANVHNPPKSPDCLVVQRCSENVYCMYIIELRDIDSPAGFEINEIVAKFITCLDNFMSQRFSQYFHKETYSFKKIDLLFISDPYNMKKYPEKQKRMQGLKVEALMAQRIPKFFNKFLYIDYKLPDPTIRNCTHI